MTSLLTKEFHQQIRQEDKWFSRAGKTFWTEFFYTKIFPLDGQTRPAKSSAQPVNLPGALPLTNSSFCKKKTSGKNCLHILSTIDMYLYTVYYILVSQCHELGVTNSGSDEPPNFTFRVKCVTCFTPNQVRSQQVLTPELIKILFWVPLHLIHYAHNVVLSAQWEKVKT